MERNYSYFWTVNVKVLPFPGSESREMACYFLFGEFGKCHKKGKPVLFYAGKYNLNWGPDKRVLNFLL
ncbi:MULTISPECIES: hypothetical protein [Aequorivita]|uniref:Uncharacterized protein n=1 Tax=Aequorivita iocasae TaxID=2803865 RepID=A0ABX7DQE1_9FLAO|nr:MULTISPECIES: hypothetical protein [Aequorivita]QQX76335.1 hypothetical protein JK629_13540 [Aequorivita iocasae]UCA55800.1 hypothetical protein LDL78_13610 [Aequorivita sp. F7]